MKERACSNCGARCCKAFYVPPLRDDVMRFLRTLLWMMPWRVVEGVQKKNIKRSLILSIRCRVGAIIANAHMLIFRAVLVRVKDPWFLARGQEGWYAVTCRLLRNDKCIVYGWFGDKVRPAYCADFTCQGQPERYIYSKYIKEVGNGG